VDKILQENIILLLNKGGDDVTNLELAVLELEKAGYEVVRAKTKLITISVIQATLALDLPREVRHNQKNKIKNVVSYLFGFINALMDN